jgi:hypothetical protein
MFMGSVMPFQSLVSVVASCRPSLRVPVLLSRRKAAKTRILRLKSFAGTSRDYLGVLSCKCLLVASSILRQGCGRTRASRMGAVSSAPLRIWRSFQSILRFLSMAFKVPRHVWFLQVQAPLPSHAAFGEQISSKNYQVARCGERLVMRKECCVWIAVLRQVRGAAAALPSGANERPRDKFYPF